MDFSQAWDKVQGMLNGATASLPNIVLGLIVSALFYVISRAISALVRHFTLGRHRKRGLVLGRLGQWLTLFVGLLIALGVIFPSVNARTQIEVLGIGTVAIGFAFRDILQNFLAGILAALLRQATLIVCGSRDGLPEPSDHENVVACYQEAVRAIERQEQLYEARVVAMTIERSRP